VASEQRLRADEVRLTSLGRVSGFELTEPLETERLVLRRFAESDFDAVFAMRSNAEIARYLYWQPESEEAARRALTRKLTNVSLREEGDILALAAVERTGGQLVADVILHWVSRDHATGEIGYIVHPDHGGKGYATEAAAPLLAVAFDEIGLHRVIGRTEARNIGSARVLEKLGMRREAHLVENEFVKGEWQSELVYAILDREWRAGARNPQVRRTCDWPGPSAT
jgi:RimJ/RimL family protein N-acetyltransferase